MGAGHVRDSIAQIQEILPDYGAGFLAACLQHFQGNRETVTNALLEGTLPPALQALDPSLAAPAPEQPSAAHRPKGAHTDGVWAFDRGIRGL